MKTEHFDKFKKVIDSAHFVKTSDKTKGYEVLATKNGENYKILITECI